MNSLGLRGGLLLIIAVALVPAFGLLIWMRVDNSRAQSSNTEQRAIARAQMIAEGQASRDQAAEQLLAALTHHASLRDPASPECTNYLREVMDAGISAYINLGVVTPDGVIICGSDPNLGLRVSDRQFFTKAMETHAFTIGELIKGRRTGRMLLNYALPLTNEIGRAHV